MNNWSTKWDKTSSGTYASNALHLENGWDNNPNMYMLSNITRPDKSITHSVEKKIVEKIIRTNDDLFEFKRRINDDLN